MAERIRSETGAPESSPSACRTGQRILNIAGYRFVALGELVVLRDRLLETCRSQSLRGTILLAPEGINLFLAGDDESIETFLDALDADPRLSGIDLKKSRSREIPFQRLKVRIRREIITLGRDGIDPARDPAPSLDPETLKSWLDDGREVLLLDTRNAVEVEDGTFIGAVHLGNGSFRSFAGAAARLRPPAPGVPIVTFCTGGIRCEKAAPLLRQLGHRNVFQLSGGIQRYFERVGRAHYTGACFVFDERGALDPDLREPGEREAQKTLQL